MEYRLVETTKEEFDGLHKLVFGNIDPNMHPPIVIVAMQDKELIGFISGYFHNLNTFYIQALGIVPAHQKKGHARFFKEATAAILEGDVRYLMGWINAKDNVTLRIALSNGFHIMGTRTTTKGKLLVEIIKEKSE